MQRTRANSTRRQTLGGIGPGNANINSRRQSVDPSSHAHGSVKRPPRGRASMIPRVGRENMIPPTPTSARQDSNRRASSAMNTRRQSTVGDRRQSVMPPSAPAIQDPRPILNKAYQQDCIRELLAYLQKSGYEHPISQKSLARPSGKDFSNIVTFMLRRVDPSFQDGTLKIEDEIAMNFKAMGYPFAVSKTALVAAGSPHTWPTLLAALTWLAKRLQCMENLIPDEDDNHGGQFESVEELEIKTDRYFFSYLSASYVAFLKGDEKLREELEMRLADRLEGDDNILMHEIEQMTDRNGAVVEKMNNLSLGDKDLDDLMKKRDSYATDLEQFHDLIDQMDQHVTKLKQKKNDQSNELEETSKKLTTILSKVEQLKESINSQELSIEDVHKMQNEQKGYEEAFERAFALRDQRRSELWEIESEIENFWSKVESLVSDYNSYAGDLKILPMMASKDVEMMASIDKDAALDPNPTKLIGVDLPGNIQPILTSCYTEYSEMTAESKSKYQEALDKLEKSEEAFTEALERHRIVEKKIDKCEETMEAEREAQDAKLGVRMREAESIETKVASLRDPVALEEQMARYQQQVTELESLKQQHEEDNVARKAAVCEEIDRAILAMKEYDQFCMDKISEVQKYKEERRSKYGKIKIPETEQTSRGYND
mmetsp:Transcript_9450/g.28194  ORF Transcript_9450/g.28194 Transcript_9450/m.28194 type:complete len:657 (-) Transcript_9450:1678-3648(-)